MRVDIPDVRYARSGDVAIAYQAVGSAPLSNRGRERLSSARPRSARPRRLIAGLGRSGFGRASGEDDVDIVDERPQKIARPEPLVRVAEVTADRVQHLLEGEHDLG